MIVQFILLLMLAQAGENYQSNYFKVLEKQTSTIENIFVAIASGSDDSWSKLATPQARRVLAKLGSDAGTLYKKNEALQDDMQSHISKQTEQDLDIGSRNQRVEEVGIANGERA